MFEEVFIERVRHLYSRCQSTDEELALLAQIGHAADLILLQPLDDAFDSDPILEATVYTASAIVHFYHFRNHYEGHASRALIPFLRHFAINVPLAFVLAHPFILIDLETYRIVTHEREFTLAERPGGLRIVERVDWAVSVETLARLQELAQEREMAPEVLVELTFGLVDSDSID